MNPLGCTIRLQVWAETETEAFAEATEALRLLSLRRHFDTGEGPVAASQIGQADWTLEVGPAFSPFEHESNRPANVYALPDQKLAEGTGDGR